MRPFTFLRGMFRCSNNSSLIPAIILALVISICQILTLKSVNPQLQEIRVSIRTDLNVDKATASIHKKANVTNKEQIISEPISIVIGSKAQIRIEVCGNINLVNRLNASSYSIHRTGAATCKNPDNSHADWLVECFGDECGDVDVEEWWLIDGFCAMDWGVVRKGKRVDCSKASLQNYGEVVNRTDWIMQPGWDNSPIVLTSHRLLLFTTPKVGCTVLRQLARRMMGLSDWQRANTNIPHNPKHNGLRYLRDFSEKEATEMMTSNHWTRAIFLRDPHSRILSAYIDKVVKTDHVKRMCGHQPSSFEEFIKMECTDPHWDPQRSNVDDKWWPYINFVGYIETAAADMEQLLRRVGAWEQYGSNGWGDGAIFKSKATVPHATNAKSKLEEYYNEKLWQMVSDQEGDPYCPRTRSIKILNGTTFQSLTVESKHSVLRPKVQRGDEYYVDSGHGTKSMSVLDLGNGRYQIQNATTSPVRIRLQYTCRFGKLSPSSKKRWADGMAINQEFWRNITMIR